MLQLSCSCDSNYKGILATNLVQQCMIKFRNKWDILYEDEAYVPVYEFLLLKKELYWLNQFIIIGSITIRLKWDSEIAFSKEYGVGLILYKQYLFLILLKYFNTFQNRTLLLEYTFFGARNLPKNCRECSFLWLRRILWSPAVGNSWPLSGKGKQKVRWPIREWGNVVTSHRARRSRTYMGVWHAASSWWSFHELLMSSRVPLTRCCKQSQAFTVTQSLVNNTMMINPSLFRTRRVDCVPFQTLAHYGIPEGLLNHIEGFFGIFSMFQTKVHEVAPLELLLRVGHDDIYKQPCKGSKVITQVAFCSQGSLSPTVCLNQSYYLLVSPCNWGLCSTYS